MLPIKDVSTRSAGKLLNRSPKVSAAQVDQVSGEFESQFITQMLSTLSDMRDPEESLGGSDAEEVYDSMLNSEYGKIIARTGGLGVADQVKRVMIAQQEVERN